MRFPWVSDLFYGHQHSNKNAIIDCLKKHLSGKTIFVEADFSDNKFCECSLKRLPDLVINHHIFFFNIVVNPDLFGAGFGLEFSEIII